MGVVVVVVGWSSDFRTRMSEEEMKYGVGSDRMVK